MSHTQLTTEILALVAVAPAGGLAADEIMAQVRASRPTVNRALRRLVDAGELRRTGASVSTRYERPGLDTAAVPAVREPAPTANVPLTFGADAQGLLAALRAPLASRAPVGYQRSFVDDYRPNETHLLPLAAANRLYAEGRSREQQPAGTYARKALEQLLIDLSWNSSRLEGNRFNLIDTRKLFEMGAVDVGDRDATMLLNHKESIEFLVDAVPEQGITVQVIRNLHGILMQSLLDDETAVGTIRRRIVNIEGSVYTPTQMPTLLQEMLGLIVDKARLIKNPVEAAFFLWVQIAYLQPFEDGNKRTSRLSANLPLLLANCAPLSFLDVDAQDYAHAMLGIYERTDVSVAADLFEWTYRRSIDKYRVVRESIGAPDPLRVRYRTQISTLIQRVVGGETLDAAFHDAGIDEPDRDVLRALVVGELHNLEAYNCARFRIAPGIVERWIAAGRCMGPTAEDAPDLEAFDERKVEPIESFEDFVKGMKQHGLT